MSSAHGTRIAPPPTPWNRIAAVGLTLAIGVSIVILAFSWPAVTSSVKSVPLAVAGPDAVVQQVESALAESAPDAFSFMDSADRADAVAQIEKREVYGAIILGDSPEILTSSAASPIVSQMLNQIAPKLAAQLTASIAAQGVTLPAPIAVAVTDVVPLADSDPQGAGLTVAAFPLTLGGILGGILASILIVGAWRRIAAIAIYVVVAGLSLAGILQGWFGILQGEYLVNAGAIALALLAVSSTIVGVASLVGRVGVAVGPVLFLLIASPLSAANQPMEFLPQPWGLIGQWFPPGAGATLLRELSYFPDAPTTFPWLVLVGWAAAGLALAVVGHFRAGVTAGVENEFDASGASPSTEPELVTAP